MSGRGLLPATPDWALIALAREAVTDELADVLAYLEQRRDNAAAIAARMSEHDELADLARDRRRQLDVQIDELRCGLHHGSAAVRAALTAPQQEAA